MTGLRSKLGGYDGIFYYVALGNKSGAVFSNCVLYNNDNMVMEKTVRDADGKIEALRVGAAGGLVTAYGLTLQEYVAIVTLVYLVFQIVILLPKAFLIIRGWFKREQS